MTRLTLATRVACPFSVAVAYTGAYFSEKAPRFLNLCLRLGLRRFPIHRVVMTAKVQPDDTDRAREHDALTLLIRPLGIVPFPVFHGLLTVRPHMPPGTQLALELTYEPPLGRLGRLFEVAVGRRIGVAAAQALVGELCAFLEARAREHARIAPDFPRLAEP